LERNSATLPFVPSNQVQLITYADRMAGDIPRLRTMLDGPLAGLFGGVHVLPFFQPFDGADAGFDPQDHTRVDPRLGTWDDVRALASGRELVVDVIVNHVSGSSPQFLDVVAHGDRSSYAGMFLTYGTVFPDGATEDELLRLYRPRPGLPFTPIVLGGRRRLVWTTFTPAQVDVDVRNKTTRDYLLRILDTLASAGTTLVRLDAVGYAVKTRGSTGFMTEDTFAFIDEMTAWSRERGMEVLVEVHSYFESQIAIASRVDLVYDFALPPLVLHALMTSDGEPLRRWLEIRPVNAVTVLDTHDGIGVIDVGADANDRSRAGLLTPEQVDALVEGIHARSGGGSRLATGAAASNLDLYQVNCTFYDALGRDDARYLMARALQLFTPGIPQVYYVGLLAGLNDVELLQRTGVGRDVNRHYYSADEVEQALARDVVRAQAALFRFRNTHPAFAGTFAASGEGHRLVLSWREGEHLAELDADLRTASALFRVSRADGTVATISSYTDLPAS